MGDCAASESTVNDHIGRPVPTRLETDKDHLKPSVTNSVSHDDIISPVSPKIAITPPIMRRHATLDLDDYFTGPRDISKHSKWPLPLQIHGSILPKMVMPLLMIGAWATGVTLVSKKVHDLGVQSVLLTITGFVVGLGLSFRSSTAYERYNDGRKFWSTIILASHNLGRALWIHARDRQDLDPRESLLRKISSMNIIVAFTVALKHSLRFEPYTEYADMSYLVGHLNTFAREATSREPGSTAVGKKGFFKGVGEYLGVSFAESNPRKALKRASHHVGNLPLEILNHLAATIDDMVANDQYPVPAVQTQMYSSMMTLNDAMCGCERVLSTPLPIAYSIAISQITWVYVILLPFQLIPLLDWVAIPATIAASYIILGLLLIGREIENPFGHDVNDLPLDSYCEQIATDMDIIASFDKTQNNFLMHKSNMPLYPVSSASPEMWMHRSESKLREAIKTKQNVIFGWRHLGMGKEEEKGRPGDHQV